MDNKKDKGVRHQRPPKVKTEDMDMKEIRDLLEKKKYQSKRTPKPILPALAQS